MSDVQQDTPLLTEESRPKLASFVRMQRDEVRESWVLQAPERILILDETGKAILDRCGEGRSLKEITETLAAEYDAPPGEIAEDVIAVLTLLAERGFLEYD